MAEDAIKENIELTDEIDGSDEAETQVYELGFHIAPSVEENNVAVEADAVKFLIKSKGGTFIAEEFPKRFLLPTQ